MSRRDATVLLVLVGIVFAAGVIGGFVYAHDPRPDSVAVRLSTDTVGPDETFIAGTIVSIDGLRLELATEAGAVTVELTSETPVEELLPAAPSEMTAGTPANVGGNLADAGPVLTGVVTLEASGDER